VKLRAMVRKYRFEEVPAELPRWQELPLEERLQAVVEIATFWLELQGREPAGTILPVARRRPLGKSSG
jgi:hypothetical protein